MPEEQTHRPSAQDVARRAFALALLKFRTGYEEGWGEETAEQREQSREDVADLGEFLRKTGLDAALSNKERMLFDRAPGQWHPQDVREYGWRGETLLALLWALGRVKTMPPIWEQSLRVHAFAEEEGKAFVTDASLRPLEEIERMEVYVQAVRLRERTPEGFEGIPWLAVKAEDSGGRSPIQGDLPIDGRPFGALDPGMRNDIRSIALERHRALVWTLGYEDDLDAPAPEV